jgi:hypothetical protein
MAMLCRGLEKNSMVRRWHGLSMASVNQTRPHCVNQMGKTHSKPLAARHAMCESAFKVMKTSRVQLLDQFSDNQLKQKLKPRHSPGVYIE